MDAAGNLQEPPVPFPTYVELECLLKPMSSLGQLAIAQLACVQLPTHVGDNSQLIKLPCSMVFTTPLYYMQKKKA